jgi:hypothetical protein
LGRLGLRIRVASGKRPHNAIKQPLKRQYNSLDAEPLSNESEKDQLEKKQKNNGSAKSFERYYIDKHRDDENPNEALFSSEISFPLQESLEGGRALVYLRRPRGSGNGLKIVRRPRLY